MTVNPHSWQFISAIRPRSRCSAPETKRTSSREPCGNTRPSGSRTAVIPPNWAGKSAKRPSGKATVSSSGRCARIDGTQFPTNILLNRIDCDGETLLQATIRDISPGIADGGGARGQTRETGRYQPASTIAPDAAPLDQKLESITDGVVRLFDADFCRIWLIGPGDLCEKGCIHAAVLKARTCAGTAPIACIWWRVRAGTLTRTAKPTAAFR